MQQVEFSTTAKNILSALPSSGMVIDLHNTHRQVEFSTTAKNILSALPSSGMVIDLHNTHRQVDQSTFDDSGITRTVVKRGRFSIEGSYLKLPEREFIIRETNSRLFFDTKPHSPWPHISFALKIRESPGEDFSTAKGSLMAMLPDWWMPILSEDSSATKEAWVIGPILRPASNTASAEIFYCLTFLDLAQAGVWQLEIEGMPDLKLSAMADPGEVERLTRRLDFFRQVRLIEIKLGTEFAIPTHISELDAENVYYLSRGIEEGTFAIPMNEWRLIGCGPPSNMETLTKLEQPTSLAMKSTGKLQIFHKELDFGPFEIRIESCQVADKYQLEEFIKRGYVDELRLKVLSGEVVWQFLRYLRPTQEEIEEIEMGELIARIHEILEEAGAMEDDTLVSLRQSREAVFRKLYPDIKLDE